MSRPRGPRRSEALSSPLALLAELRPAVEALRRAMALVRIGGPSHAALGAVHAALHRLAEALGHPDHYSATDHVNVGHRTSPVIRARPEPPNVPSMPDRSPYDVVEDDDGTYAVVWSATGRVVKMDGAPQRGLTIERADDVADLLEAMDRIAEGRRGGRLDG